MATPADAVETAVELVNEWHAAPRTGGGGAPAMEWPE